MGCGGGSPFSKNWSQFKCRGRAQQEKRVGRGSSKQVAYHPGNNFMVVYCLNPRSQYDCHKIMYITHTALAMHVVFIDVC